MKCAYCGSDRFVRKKTLGGSPSGKRVEAPQALTCNTNTGVRIDPPGAQMDGDSGGGGKKSLGGLNPNPPANRTLDLDGLGLHTSNGASVLRKCQAYLFKLQSAGIF